MSNVGLGHDQTIVARTGQHSSASRTTMNCYELTNLVSLTDLCFGWFALVLQVLRCETDGDERKNVGLSTY